MIRALSRDQRFASRNSVQILVFCLSCVFIVQKNSREFELVNIGGGGGAPSSAAVASPRRYSINCNDKTHNRELGNFKPGRVCGGWRLQCNVIESLAKGLSSDRGDFNSPSDIDPHFVIIQLHCKRARSSGDGR